MASMKKILILGVIIPIFSIFLMSHNVSAADTVIDISDYDVSLLGARAQMNCQIDSNTLTNSNYCSTTATGVHSVMSLKSGTSYSFKKDDILEFDLAVFNAVSPTNYPKNFTIVNLQYDNQNFKILGFKDISNTYENIPLIMDYDGNITNITTGYKIIRFSFKVLKDGTFPFGFESNSTTYPLFTFQDTLYFKYFNINRFRPLNSKDKANQEQEEATQEAVDDSEDAGDSSSSSAETASASLLSAITGFFSVITAASPTNCVFNAPLNTHFGNQRLNVDLCSLDLPPQIGALTSIIAIGIIIPFAIHMFKKFINLFRSFQS